MSLYLPSRHLHKHRSGRALLIWWKFQSKNNVMTKFPDMTSQNSLTLVEWPKFPDIISKFLDFSLTWRKFCFSLTFPWHVATLLVTGATGVNISGQWGIQWCIGDMWGHNWIHSHKHAHWPCTPRYIPTCPCKLYDHLYANMTLYTPCDHVCCRLPSV